MKVPPCGIPVEKDSVGGDMECKCGVRLITTHFARCLAGAVPVQQIYEHAQVPPPHFTWELQMMK